MNKNINNSIVSDHDSVIKGAKIKINTDSNEQRHGINNSIIADNGSQISESEVKVTSSSDKSGCLKQLIVGVIASIIAALILSFFTSGN